MKRMKKLFAILMTMAMVMGLGITGFAAEKDAKITIDHAGSTAKFNYVQIVTANQETETGWDIVDEYFALFQSDNAFGQSATEQDVLKAMIYKATDGEQGVEIRGFDEKYANALDAIRGYIPAPEEGIGYDPEFTVNSAGVYVIAGYEEGFIYGTMAAYVGFDKYTAGVPADLTDATVEAKRVPTTVDKDSDDTDKVTEIGKTVTYTVTGTVPYIAPTELEKAEYWVTDKITGASYKLENKFLKVTVTTTPGNYRKVYDVTPKTIEGKNGFTLNLTEILANNQYANDTITISYQAVVTDIKVGNEVLIGKGENDGDYGHDSDTSYTGEIELLKLASDDTEDTNDDNEKLANAEFVMYKIVQDEGADTTHNEYATVKNGKLTGWITEKDDATRLITDTNGKIKVEGLDLGTYYFEETKAPEGYSLDSAPVDVQLSIDGTTASATVTGEQAVKFNNTLSALPSTGGMGTTIFTIAGCVIMISAAGLFFASRRKAN